MNKNSERQFDSEIIEDIPEGEGSRQKALHQEKKYSDQYREDLEEQYHKRP